MPGRKAWYSSPLAMRASFSASSIFSIFLCLGLEMKLTGTRDSFSKPTFT
jgi:hypothetical protein